MVYVYGLTPRVLERHLDEIFGFYGPIKRLRLFRTFAPDLPQPMNGPVR